MTDQCQIESKVGHMYIRCSRDAADTVLRFGTPVLACTIHIAAAKRGDAAVAKSIERLKVKSAELKPIAKELSDLLQVHIWAETYRQPESIRMQLSAEDALALIARLKENKA